MNEAGKTPGNRTPFKTVIWTLFAIVAITGLYLGAGSLNENANIEPGLVNLLKLLLVFLTIVVWLTWLAFFSRVPARFLVTLICMGLMVLFFYVFQLRLDGDLGFVGFAPRFSTRDFQPLDANMANSVDLSSTSSKDFNQFLGNDRSSVVRGRVLNANWTENPPKLLWKQPIGEGWSGFSAVNGYAVTQEQRGQDECVTCYDILTGKLQWIFSSPRRHEDTMAMGKVGPRATPTIHDGRVFVQGATGVVDCLDGSNGSPIWSVDLTELLNIEQVPNKTSLGFTYEFENSALAWGRSCSPLVYNDSVIVTGGGPRNGPLVTLIAFDKNTGQEKWRGGTSMIAYGSPSIANILGQTQITLVAESEAMGFDPATGHVLWRTPREGASDANANCSQVTPISNNRILLSKAYQLGGEVVELSQTGDEITTKTIWKNPRALKTKMMSPVILDGHAYALSDGFLECTDIVDDAGEGKRVWRKRGRFGNGQLLLVGDLLLVHTEYGALKLIRAIPDRYEQLGEIKTIDGICWNTICLYDRYLLVRSELEAACYELKTAVQGVDIALEPVDSIESESTDGAKPEVVN